MWTPVKRGEALYIFLARVLGVTRSEARRVIVEGISVNGATVRDVKFDLDRLPPPIDVRALGRIFICGSSTPSSSPDAVAPPKAWPLPNELTFLVLEYLGQRDRANMMRTCSVLYGVTRDPALWEKVVVREFLAARGDRALSNSQRIRLMLQCPYIVEAVRHLDFTGTKFVTDVTLEDVPLCKQLQVLSLRGQKEISADEVARLVEECPELNILNLVGCTQLPQSRVIGCANYHGIETGLDTVTGGVPAVGSTIVIDDEPCVVTSVQTTAPVHRHGIRVGGGIAVVRGSAIFTGKAHEVDLAGRYQKPLILVAEYTFVERHGAYAELKRKDSDGSKPGDVRKDLRIPSACDEDTPGVPVLVARVADVSAIVRCGDWYQHPAFKGKFPGFLWVSDISECRLATLPQLPPLRCAGTG